MRAVLRSTPTPVIPPESRRQTKDDAAGTPDKPWDGGAGEGREVAQHFRFWPDLILILFRGGINPNFAAEVERPEVAHCCRTSFTRARELRGTWGTAEYQLYRVHIVYPPLHDPTRQRPP